MTGNILKIIVGVTIGGFLVNAVIGLAFFAMINDAFFQYEAQYSSQAKTRQSANARPELPVLPHSKDLPSPLLLDTRARLSFKIDGIVGYGTDGWTARYNTLQDAIALRPDLDLCLSAPAPECYTIAKSKRDMVFVKGDKRIYVKAKFWRSGLTEGLEKDEIATLQDTYKDRRWLLGKPKYPLDNYLTKDWVTLEPWNGFNMKRLDNKGGKGAYFLRVYLKGDGQVTLNILTNAPLDEVKAQLAAMDLDLLHALVTPVPYGGLASFEDHVTDVMNRRAERNRFTVLSDAEIAAKVDAMPADARLAYASGLVRIAKRRGLSVFDYNVVYHPKGAQGLQDTRDFLAGKIAKDDPRYAVLDAENDRDFPIGTCLSTSVEVLCKGKAQDLRTALEVTRQAAATQPADDATAQAGYSEEQYKQDMRDLERQMQIATQKLVQLRAGND